MSLDFTDERYVRAFTRDTPNWVLGPWQARAVLVPVMRKLDRAGTLDLGDDGLEALAALVLLPLEVVEVGMAWWVRKGTFELVDGRLVMPRFLDGQEAKASDAQRAREHRARTRDRARVGEATVTDGDETITSRDSTVTPRDGTVTRGHAPSHGVTPSCAVPSRAVPPVPSRTEPERVLVLTSEPTGPRGRRAKKSKPEIPGHQDVIACFAEEYDKVRHAQPIIDAKAGKGAKELLKKTGSADAACAVIRRAFAQSDFVRGTHSDLKFIADNVNDFRGTPPVKTNGRQPPVQPAAPPGERAFRVGRQTEPDPSQPATSSANGGTAG